MTLRSGMRPVAHGCLLFLFGILAYSGDIHADDVPKTRFGPPPTSDLIGNWVEGRLHEDPVTHPLLSDSDYLNGLLADPASPYSTLKGTVFPQEGSSLLSTAWRRAMAAVPRRRAALNSTEGTLIMAWDLGLTKALPGMQAPLPEPVIQLNSGWEASLMKAGVRSVYANQVLRITDHQFPAVAANYAVALQILRDKLDKVDGFGRATVGLRGGVLTNFMLAESIEDVSDYDLFYLAKLLQSELSAWHAGGESRSGHRQLPTPLRIARVAAAFRDAIGYRGIQQPCGADGRFNPDYISDGGEFCFIDATDRAVFDWYRGSLLRELQTEWSTFRAPRGRVAHMVGEIDRMRPSWAVAFGKHVEGEINRIEIVEMLAAHEGFDGNTDDTLADRFVDRANDYLCRIPTP